MQKEDIILKCKVEKAKTKKSTEEEKLKQTIKKHSERTFFHERDKDEVFISYGGSLVCTLCTSGYLTIK